VRIEDAITDIEVRPIKLQGRSGILAFCDLVLCGSYKIRNLRVVKLRDGEEIVGWPNKEDNHGKPRAVFHPLTRAAEEDLVKFILDKYHEKVDTM